MHVEQIADNGEEVRLRVVATADEMTHAFTDGIDAFVEQYQLEEFEGDTASEKLIAAFGEEEAQPALYSAVINFLVPFALEEYGVAPLSTYGIESDDEPDQDKPYSFEMTVLLKPEFELTNYEPATVSIDPVPTVSDEDIEAQMLMLARQVAAAQQGKDPQDTTLELPAITDAWVNDVLKPMGMQVDSVEELRQCFKDTSTEELMRRYEQEKMDRAMQEYVQRLDGSASPKMVDAMTQELYETFLAELARDGMTFEAFAQSQNMTEDEVRTSLAQQATYQLMQGFVLDAIFRHEKLELGIGDLMAAIRNIAPGREDETFDAMQKTGRGFLLKEGAARMKAAEWVMNNTTFVVGE